jgi:hypothetical protein
MNKRHQNARRRAERLFATGQRAALRSERLTHFIYLQRALQLSSPKLQATVSYG